MFALNVKVDFDIVAISQCICGVYGGVEKGVALANEPENEGLSVVMHVFRIVLL